MKSGDVFFCQDSVNIQRDNTVDKGLISVSFALLSFRVRPVRVNQVP